MSTRSKTVLAFLPSGGENEVRILGGIQDVALSRHWAFSSAECRDGGNGALRILRSPDGGTVGEMLAKINPDGVIVIHNAVKPSTLRQPGRRAMPTVFIDRPVGIKASRRTFPVCVFGEDASFARLAAAELFRSGFRDYAFLTYPDDPPWSRERGKCFARIIAEAGMAFHPFPAPSGGNGATYLVAHVAPFLDSLPKPCGIFAANDALGEAALRVCAQRGWAVPQDIAIVGVDNLEFICEGTTPTLSSISRDWNSEGCAAAELLAEWMAEPDRRPASRIVPASHVVRRASTFFAADRRVAQAMEFIRRHACEEGFGPRDVVREMGCSRTLADSLFRKVDGRTILDEIHGVRLARAKEFLLLGKPADFVASACGYASYDDFCRVFKRRVGSTVRKWALAEKSPV